MAKRAKLMTSRRGLLKGAAAAGLIIGFRLGPAEAAGTFAPNAFVRIASDDTVTIVAKHIEFGQGVYTGLATILAEELDADWRQVEVVPAPANARLYNNLAWGPVQGTGGSNSIANSWQQLRQAGATARLLLVQAAAATWSVPAAEIAVSNGVLSHAASKRGARFGAMAQKAAALPPPWTVELKQPRDFKLIGKKLPRIDVPVKIDGSALYALDVTPPNALTALLARPPRFGGTMKSFDATATRQIPGVVDVVAVPVGVAVLATGFWAASKGRDALKIEWDESKAEKRGTAELVADYRKRLDTPGFAARSEGNADAAIAGAAKRLGADYEFPFLAHAPMEPLNCVVALYADRCRVWSGSQLQTIDQQAAAIVAGLKPEQIDVFTMLAGGSFGRRGSTNADLVAEAVMIARAIGGRAPVKLVWTREDDIRGGHYRPLYLHRLRAGLDAAGHVAGWHHRIVGQPIAGNGRSLTGIDRGMVQGAVDLPYAIANLAVEAQATDVGVPTLWWRSVGSSHNAYATETFIDELAVAARKDPLAFRLALLKQQPRPAGVLKLAAEKAGWGRAPPPGRARGIAVHEWAGTFVAQVAEVSIKDGAPKVERVVCAVDCGIAVNPDIVAAQMEGGIAFGLSAALRGAITLTKGAVDQSNFHDYQPLRMSDMPAVEVHIVPSQAAPSGVGEAGVPPTAPAVANAVFAATGKRVRKLPFESQDLRRE